MLTEQQRTAYRNANARLETLIARASAGLVAHVPTDNPPAVVEALSDLLPNVVEMFGDASATVAAAFYELSRDADPAARGTFSTELAPNPPADQIVASGRWATGPLWVPQGQVVDLGAFRDRLAFGTIGRLVRNVGRNTVALNAEREGVRYARVPRDKACGFCRMLAGRGAVYHTDADATAGHDHCHCTAERIAKAGKLPYDAKAIERDFTESTRGLSGEDAVREYNRVVAARHAAPPAAPVELPTAA